jgi:fructosamine-3-kinase
VSADASLAVAIGRSLGIRVHADACAVTGGSINDAWRYETERGPIFVKLSARTAADMFAAEADGLEALASAAAVPVPRVLSSGCNDSHAWLALEWIDFGAQTPEAGRALGEALARQHRSMGERFGWRRYNTIGATPQRNDWREHWVGFLREWRLGFQLELALARGARSRVIECGRRLCERLEDFFPGYTPVPSLLHGDLWGGNWGVTENGNPVIFDPAVYYGDREADIAMTRLFGGFGPEFYAAYESAWPLDAGAATRIRLYNLYHVLNHYNLFGGGYLSQAESMIDRLLAELAA